MDASVRPRLPAVIAFGFLACALAASLDRDNHASLRKESDSLPRVAPASALLGIHADGSQVSLVQDGARLGSLLHTLVTKTDIEAVAFSPNGYEVATGSADNATTIWNAESGLALRTFYYHQDKVTFLAYSPDAQMILSGAKDGRAVIWNPATTLVEREFDNDSPVESVAFGRSGMYIMTGSDDRMAKIWDTRNGKLLCTLHGHDGKVLAVALNPQGGTAVTGSDDFTAKIWKIDECIATSAGNLFSPEQHLVGHTGAINDVTYSPYGRWIATASQDFTVRLWEAKTGKSLRLFGLQGGAHLGSVEAVAWKPSPKTGETWKPHHDQVLTGSADGTAKLWMAHTGLLVHTFNHGGTVTSVSFDPEGKRIVTGSSDGTAKVWSLSNYQSSSIMRGNLVRPVKLKREYNTVTWG